MKKRQSIPRGKKEWETFQKTGLGKLSTVRVRLTDSFEKKLWENERNLKKSIVYKINKLSQGPISTSWRGFMDEESKIKGILTREKWDKEK